MKILALDSSGLVASVAVVENDTLLAEYTVNYKKTHSQTLLPMLDEIVKMTQTELSEMDAIAVAAGPGSFTGLRIGSATAKGLGLALNKPIISVPTLEGIACNFYGTDAIICPMMDARRKQVYTALYRFDKADRLETIFKQTPMDIIELITLLNDRNEEVVFVGDGIDVYSQTIKENIKVPYAFAPAHMNKQRAGSVAAAAQIRFADGKYQNGDDFAPEYLRQSQAERERTEKEKAVLEKKVD